MTNLNLNKVYRFSKLLKIESIQKEVLEFLKGFNLKNIKLNNNTWECFFDNDRNEYLKLNVAVKDNQITMIKSKKDFFEYIKIDKDLKMVHEIIERRPKGIIYSIITKKFDLSFRFKNKIVLVDLEEERFVFSEDSLKKLMNSFNGNTLLSEYFLNFRKLKNQLELDTVCDCYTNFSTHMNYYFTLDDKKIIKDNIYPTRTYLNGKDISSIFCVYDSDDKIYKVYDLYHGIINRRNEDELSAINLGFLSPNLYDLKTFEGITQREDSIVGESLDSNEIYLNYLKEMFYNKFGFNGYLELNRDSILRAITYKMPIEETRGEKVGIDNRIYIDGIPVDSNHILTMEQVDKKIDELNTQSSARILNLMRKNRL